MHWIVRPWSDFCGGHLQLTMSNVDDRSNLLWIHCLMTWVVSLVIYNVSAPLTCANTPCSLTHLQMLSIVLRTCQGRTASPFWSSLYDVSCCRYPWPGATSACTSPIGSDGAIV